MKFIKLPYSPRVKSVRQVKFGGLDRSPGAAEGSIFDMENITSSAYPAIKRRPPRGAYNTAPAGADDAIFGTDGTLYYIKDGGFYAGGVLVGTTNAKKMCLLGNNYVVVSEPGFAIYNKVTGTLSATESTRYLLMVEDVIPEHTKTDEHISIEVDYGDVDMTYVLIISSDSVGRNEVEELYGAINAYGCESVIFDGQMYPASNFTYSDGVLSALTSYNLVQRYQNGRSLTFVLGNGNEISISPLSEETVIPTEYNIRISISAGGAAVSAGDSGHNPTIADWYNALSGYIGYVIKAGSEQTTLSAVSLSETGGLKRIEMTFGASIDANDEHASISVWSAAEVSNAPDLSNVFQHGNRLWGTSGDTIYASKLGDPYSWYSYDGISTDSWALEVASPGSFSAGFSYGGYPRFFKERTVLTIYGRTPEDYYTDEKEILGVKTGSERSLCVLGGYVYYLSEQGVCRWGGGSASAIISDNIYRALSDGVGGTDGRKYYLSVLSGGKRELLVYDTLFGLWHKEDDLCAIALLPKERELYALTNDGLVCISGGTCGESDYGAMIEFNDIVMGSDEAKTAQKLIFCAEVAKDATMYVYASFDGGELMHVGMINAGEKRTVEMPIIIRKNNRMKIKIECHGDFILYSMNLYYYGG